MVVASSEDITTRAKGLQGSVDAAVFPQFELLDRKYRIIGNAHYHNETCQMHFGNLGPLLDDVDTAFLSGKRVYS